MKKLLIFGFVFLFLASLALADLDNARVYWSFDDDDITGDDPNDLSGAPLFDGTTNGGVTTGIPGIILEGFDWDGTSNTYVRMAGTGSGLFASSTSPRTICLWFNSSDVTTANKNLFKEDDDAGRIQLYTGGGNLYAYDRGGSTLTKAVSINTWYHLCYTHNSSIEELYIDGASHASAASQSPLYTAIKGIYVGANGYDLTGENYNGRMDEVAIYNRTLTAAEVSELYNSGDGFNPYAAIPPAIDSLNISDSLPANNSQFNTQLLSLNLTANASLPFNADLYINGALNQTGLYSTGSNKLVDFNLTFSNTTEATFTYFFALNTSADNENTTTKTFHIDNVFPQITSDFINGSVYYNTNITGTFNLTDNLKLFSYNISIDGVEIDSAYNLNTTFYNYNLTTPSAPYKPGNHTLTVRTADGHTAQELYKPDEWEIDSGFFSSYLEFDTSQDIEITIDTSSSSIFDTFGYEQLSDRFKWTFEPSDYSQTEYTFTVDTNGSHIYIIEDDPTYQDYLIIGEHWVDFLLDTEENEVIEITRLTDTSVTINVSNVLNPEFMQFESIGDLNVRTQNFTFLTVNVSVTVTDPVIEGEPAPTLVSWDINGTGLTADSINLTFFEYNFSNLTSLVTKSSNSNHINFSATVEANGNGTSVTRFFNWSFAGGPVFNGSILYNHTVFSTILDNCSALTTQTLNFTLLDEVTDLPVNGTLEAYFQTWISNSNNFIAFNISWNTPPHAQQQFGVCMFPAFAEYISYAQFQYGATGYATKNYYFANASLTNTTKFINLLLNNASSQIQFTVLNQNDDPLENAYIKVLSYDIGTNSYVISEILKTDSEGIAYGQLVKSEGSDVQWYQFIVEYNYEVKLTTEPSKITEDTRIFRINTVDTYFEQVAKKNGLITSLTYTNSTGNFNFVFSNPAGTADTYCLSVAKQYINSESVANKSCTTASAGTILVSAPSNPENNTIIATSTVTIGGSLFPLEVLQISGSQVFKKFGKTGLFVTFLLTLTLVMVGVWSPAIATMMAIIGVGMAVILQIFMLQWSMIVIFIALGILTIYRINRQ